MTVVRATEANLCFLAHAHVFELGLFEIRGDPHLIQGKHSEQLLPRSTFNPTTTFFVTSPATGENILVYPTKAKIREVFGAAFRHAMRYELYPTNPIANVRQVQKRAVEPSILEPAEIVAILRELEGVEPVRTAFLIAAIMGMRRGEIFGLKWSDVNFERAIVHVRRSFVDGIAGPPKTDSSPRPLPIPPQASEALKAWKEKSSYAAPDHWVFASDLSFGDQPLWPGTLWRRNVAPAITRAKYRQAETGLAYPAPFLCFPATGIGSKPES